MSMAGKVLVRLLSLTVFAFAGAQAQDSPPVYLGLTGEFGVQGSTSAQAVEAGMRLAIAEINAAGGVLEGRPLRLDARDDRSVPARGVANVRDMAENPDLVAVFTAKLSPVALDILPVAHELGIPMLATWSAADGIVDHQWRPSFSFRLSMRDDWAIAALLRELSERRGHQRIGVLLPNTGWGRSSHAAAERHRGNLSLEVEWYNWGALSMLPSYNRLKERGVEALLMVANEREGAMLVREMVTIPAKERVPIASHWGITGGNFVQLSAGGLGAVDLVVVQTFSFNDPETPVRARVRASAVKHLDKDPASLPSIVGFAHAYDLTHILAEAIELAGTSNRSQIRDALEQVQHYEGLVSNYQRPFTPQRHEALSPDLVFVARFKADGTLARVSPERR